MMPEEPILSKESDELEKKISKLIGRHNVLCRVEEAFAKNERATEHFERAKDEVYASGNQSYASMLSIAIETMADAIDDQEEDPDIASLQIKIWTLESENRKLKMALEEVTKMVSRWEELVK